MLLKYISISFLWKKICFKIALIQLQLKATITEAEIRNMKLFPMPDSRLNFMKMPRPLDQPVLREFITLHAPACTTKSSPWLCTFVLLVSNKHWPLLETVFSTSWTTSHGGAGGRRFPPGTGTYLAVEGQHIPSEMKRSGAKMMLLNMPRGGGTKLCANQADYMFTCGAVE